MDKLQLMTELDQARQRLNDALAQVDERQEICPSWKLKQMLDHLSAWDEAVTVSLEAHARGEQPVITAPNGLDAFNAEALRLRATLPLDTSRQACETARLRRKELILSLPDDKYAQPFLAPWDRMITVEHMLEIYLEHEFEHAREIEQILGQA